MWVVIVPADPVYEVWPDNRRTPCSISLTDDATYAIYTSHLYPVHFIDGLGQSAKVIDIYELKPPIEGIEYSVSVGVNLRTALKTYDEYPPEGFQIDQAGIVSIDIRVALVTYDNYPPEGILLDQAAITSILMESKLVTYDNYAPEGFQMDQASITSISLTTE